MNTRQINICIMNENMSIEHLSGHILLLKDGKPIKVFHSLSNVEGYLKKRGYIPNKFYDNRYRKENKYENHKEMDF